MELVERVVEVVEIVSHLDLGGAVHILLVLEEELAVIAELVATGYVKAVAQ